MAAAAILKDDGRRHLGKISNGHIFATGRVIHSSLVLLWGFLGRQIQWRYFRFEQI